MLLGSLFNSARFLRPKLLNYRATIVPKCSYGKNIENKYSDVQKETILQVINDDITVLSSYNITKTRLKKFSKWKSDNGLMKTLSDIENVDGFSENTAKKLFDSILGGPLEELPKVTSKIKGQVLHPNLKESDIKACKTVLTVYISVNSVCWTLIDKGSYEVMEWEYYSIDYPDGKRFQITDILDIAWHVTCRLPSADLYVMKAEPTTLRAAGSDPNNPKVLAVNLQKAQMVAMIVALINNRSHQENDTDSDNEDDLKHKVYFLRPTLPFRLYGTLVGNERVSTDQTVEMLLREANGKTNGNSHVSVPETLKNMFRCQKELQKDMLGHCFLLSLTFMDLCVYRNQERVAQLLKQSTRH